VAGQVVKFLVLAGRRASLLPELVSPPDEVHFLGSAHATAISVGAGRARSTIRSCEPRLCHTSLSFHSSTLFTAWRKRLDTCSELSHTLGNTFFP
jgi:hypothetical protein